MIDVQDFAGSRIGRYDVVSLLGRGGMGAVYDALDPSLGRHVALKILPTEVAADPQRLARFIQEARAASALNHPNVVSIYEIGQARLDSRDVHFIAMEKVEGRDLRTTFTTTRLPLERAIELVAQIADAVAAAHAAGIVHRDLKPENIVLSKTGIPKVLDFGLAKLRTGDDSAGEDDATALRSTDSGMILGTVGYMSPEQAQGKPADARSDIFSLGCILYEAVSGRRAFAATSAVETLNAIIHADPPPLRDWNAATPAEMQRIVSKAMAKSPDERYQSAKELMIDLRAMLRESSRPPAERTTPRRGNTMAVIAIASVIVLLVVIALAVRSRKGPPPAAASASTAALEVRRITARGTVTHAAISPDGRFVAYALLDRTIRLRQLATGEEIEVVRIAPLAFWGLTFTPDGNSIVYAARDPLKQVASCFRVATIGGKPEHLFDGIDSVPAISPDGRRVAYGRAEYPRPGESALIVANLDGSGARVVSVRRPPELFVPLFFTGTSWSPDGKWIAAAVKRSANPAEARLILVSADGGEERTLLEGWQLVTQVSWLADGSGIVAVAAKDSDDFTRLQLWHVAYPSGSIRRITTEMSAYRGVSIAAQKDLLVSILLENNAQVWSFPMNGGRADKISTGRYDGWRGLALIPNGRVVFTNIEEDGQSLVASNRDGSGRTRLTRDKFDNQYPAAFRDGIAYVSSTPRGTEVCVTSFEGEGRRVVARDVDQSPIAVSADGAWLLFRRNRRLWKQPMQGGEATQLLEQLASAPAWSPRGDRIAVLLGDPAVYAAALTVVTRDGRIAWSTPLGSVHPGTTIHWLSDESGLVVNGSPAGKSDDQNLWQFPLRGEPRQLTEFIDQRAYFWDLTPDGKTAMLSRASLTRDAVLITGFR